ncbi:MAG: DUF883 family protein [Inquilinaceae bacterium]
MATRNVEQELDALRGDMEKLRGDIGSLTKTLRATAEQKASSMAAAAKRNVDELKSEAEVKLREGTRAVESHIEERPLSSVLIAFGVGVVIGKLMDRR